MEDSNISENARNKLSDYLPDLPSNWEGADYSFAGIWWSETPPKYHTVIPPWSQFPFNLMLDECLAAGTCGTIYSESNRTGGRPRIDIAEDKENGKPKQWIFSLDPTGPRVEAEASLGQLGRQFAAMAFIAELRKLLLRKRRTTYDTRQVTLSGRIKGKLLIGPTVRRHLSRGRLDLLESAVPHRTQENRVNEVFRYTLRLCKESLRNLPTASVQTTWTWANFCDEILSDVREIRSTLDSDYLSHGLTGFYKEHAHLLDLAKVIKINHQEPPKSTDPNTKIKTVPFLLNTWFVFERWVEARAKTVIGKPPEAKKWIIVPRKSEKNPGNGFLEFEPDILFKKVGENPRERIRILDAKCKRFWQETSPPDPKSKNYDSFRHDVHQILAYKAVFNAERVGVIFPAEKNPSEKVQYRDGHQQHQLHPGSMLSTLAVSWDNGEPNIDDILKEFLSDP